MMLMNKLQLSAAVAMLAVSSVFAAERASTSLARGYQMCVPYDASNQTLGQCRSRRSEVRDVVGNLRCALGTVKIVSEAPVRFCPEPVIL
jgi:hypothetical protein